MTNVTPASLPMLAAAALVGWTAWRHLLRTPPSTGRRREGALIALVGATAVASFAVTHVQLDRQWGGTGWPFTSWAWFGYSAVFALTLGMAHLLLRRFSPAFDEIVLPVVGILMCFGLLNVWAWETRDANAFVTSVALPQIREFEAAVERDAGLDGATRDDILDRLGPVPNELTFPAARGPAHALNPAWIDEYNDVRLRYQNVMERAPPHVDVESLAPVIVDNVFRRQLLAALVAVMVLPALAVVLPALGRRRGIATTALVAGAAVLLGLAFANLAQGTSGRLPAAVSVGGRLVTLYALAGLALVTVLPLVVARSARSWHRWLGGSAVAVAAVSMVVVDTGAGLLLVLLAGTAVTAGLGRRSRRIVFAAAAAGVMLASLVVVRGDLGVLPSRAADRLAAWTDPTSSHHDAELVNAAARTVRGLADAGAVEGGDDLAPDDAASMIDQELGWRVDALDGLVETQPFVPASPVEDLVLLEAELLWADLGGYTVARDDRVGAVLLARVSRASGIIHEAATSAMRRGGQLADLRVEPVADGLQLQRSLSGFEAGGLLGRGPGGGRPEAIPEITEDMAIVFVGEAYGLVGVLAVTGLVMTLVARGIVAARSLRRSRRDVVAGLAAMLGVQTLVNLGGVTASLPLTGLPFPLISRSGVGLVVASTAIGAITALSTPRTAPAPASAPAPRRPWGPRVLRCDPLGLVALVLVGHVAVLQLSGGRLGAGPVAALETGRGEDLLVAGDVWERPDPRSIRGPILDRNGIVLAVTESYGVRTYPDEELARSLSHSLVRLDSTMPTVDGGVGPELVTTIDAEVQRAVHRAIDAATRESGLELDGLRGAVVVLDVTTGAIVSIESRPTFSPTELQDGGLWATAEGSDRRAGFYNRHLNRAVDGAYPPGSVAKIMTAAAILQDGHHEMGEEDFDFRTGPLGPQPPDAEHDSIWHEIEFENDQRITDGHLGHLDEWLFDIEEAFAHSSNVAFALMAQEVGPERLAETARAFGFEADHEVRGYGSFTATLGPVEADGRRYLQGGRGPLAQTALGQGVSLASPLNLGLMSAVVANDGVAMAPHLVTELRHQDGTVERVMSPTELFDAGLDPQTIADLHVLMAAAVDYGTAGNAATRGSDRATRVSGKTGSAQWTEDLDATHSLFTGFFPRSAPRLAIGVVVERGGPGGGVATRIARHVAESGAVARYLAPVEGG